MTDPWDRPCVAVKNEMTRPGRWYLCERTDLHCDEYGAEDEGHAWAEVPAGIGAERWRELTGRLTS